LVDQVRSIDKQRICRRYGLVSVADLEAISMGLCLYLGLEAETQVPSALERCRHAKPCRRRSHWSTGDMGQIRQTQ
jgi:hypothetical protein